MLKRVLVVNMNYLGDALMTTPTLRLLHRTFESDVDVIAGGATGYAAGEILRGNPDIHALIPRADGGAFSRCRQLFSVITHRDYDAVVILPSIPAYRWTAILAGASRIVYVPPAPESAHMAEHMLSAVASQLGLNSEPLQLVLNVMPDARTSAAKLLARLPEQAPLIGLNLGASRPQKRWPAASFRELSNMLIARGYSVALLGSPSDKSIASRVLDAAEEGLLLDLTGQTSIPQLNAVIEQCDAIVTADTGAMHIASALQTPVVALFGSTDPGQTGPVGPGSARVIYKQLHCAPCKSHPTCGGAFDCLTSITPLEVLGAVEQVARRTTARPNLRIVSS